MKHQKPLLAVMLLFVLSLFACDSNEIGDSKDVNQDKIYMDYEISYNEPDADVELSFQYRFAGSAGTTLVLNDASQVTFDGEKLKVDSSEGSGAFYDTRKKFNSFTGKHTIRYTDIFGKQFENSFDFAPFTISPLPEVTGRNKDLVISFNGLPLGSKDHIEINSIGTDSSFHIQQAGPTAAITIPAKQLQRQTDKNLTIGCRLYREIPLTQTTSEGGSLKLYYNLEPVKITLYP